LDQTIRNKLRGVVTQCRKLLEDSTAQALQGRFGIYPSRKKGEVQIEDEARMAHLTEEDRDCRQDLLDHLEHIQAIGYKPSEALEQLVREISFTHLNRLCAYKMMESRGLIREAVSRGLKSQGFFFYLADHPEDEKLHNSGGQEMAYRNFLDWLGGTLSQEIGVLFNPNDPANRIYPPQRVLDEVLALINDVDLKDIWSQDETIGWVYQYFTPKDLRDKARKESQAPRNSYELAFRNQFFTPRYVVEFLTDNTLGRIWYEMRKGKTILKDRCKYLVRRPMEIFLKDGEQPPAESKEAREDLSQEELLKQPVYIPHRPKKDPRELKVLDPACGSGHFLLYCFDLLQVIYEEAYDDPDLVAALRKDYPAIEDLRRAVPALILKHNLHGIDIDLRATQIAALALWLRCQRAYQEMGLKNGERPKITRSNIVCAEPMPGEMDLLKEFTATLQPKVLGQLVETVFERMKLAGEAGSLLKIEEEIREAAGKAKFEFIQWKKHLDKAKWSLFPELVKRDQPSIFDFADMTDEVFLDRVEEEIVAALQQYAEKASNGRGFRRRLFAEDAARGFAFIDLSRNRYDVVLMNPPFGAPTVSTKDDLVGRYEGYGNDVFTFFVARGASLLSPDGRLGAITNRTGFFTVSQENWRDNVLLGNTRLEILVDLGYGVLDALVETSAYVVANSEHVQLGMFHRAIAVEDKTSSINSWVSSWINNTHEANSYLQLLEDFRYLPSLRIAFWMPRSLLLAFRHFERYKDFRGNVQVGLQTSDNFRFIRLAWEVNLATIGLSREDTLQYGKRWVFYAKGGEYAPYYADVHLLVNWLKDGEEVKSFTDSNGKVISYPRNERHYFKPGLTYTERTTSNFSARIMPAGCCFDTVGPRISSDSPENDLVDVAVYMTRPMAYLLEFMVGSADVVYSGSAARHYTPRAVAEMPYPKLDKVSQQALSRLMMQAWAAHREIESLSETDRYFVTPFLVSQKDQNLHESFFEASKNREDKVLRILSASADAEIIVRRSLKLELDALQAIQNDFGVHPCEYEEHDINSADFVQAYTDNLEQVIDEETADSGASRAVTKLSYYADRRVEVLCHKFRVHPQAVVDARRKKKLNVPGYLQGETAALISYQVGVIVGRWDIRFATGERQHPKLPDPFDPLPVCPPGMLQGPDGLPAKPEDVPSNYPIRIDWDGILVDDPGHEDDIIRRVQDVLEAIWKDRAEAIEREACEILGVQELRDYFRKPGNSGFWMDHVKRYSKSRRKAPIYWYLRSAKGNYGLWLYYHRLDKDILFKALLNYVEPKIRMEEDRLKSLRGRKEAAGSSGREAKQIEKDMDRQEQFVSELHDFADKLRRAANLHLIPDLNDGVVLTIAPLFELVPWKEAKEYWEDLVEGKYEWSSIGKQMREKGLVKK